jgi:hypothetical protein
MQEAKMDRIYIYDGGEKECISNSGDKTSLKTTNWKAKKVMGEQY